MATFHQVFCNVLPDTTEYFKDMAYTAIVEGTDVIEFIFDSQITIEDILINMSGGNLTSGEVRIVYPDSDTRLQIKSSIASGTDWFLNDPDQANVESYANMWYTIPAGARLQFAYNVLSIATSLSVKVCAVGRSS